MNRREKLKKIITKLCLDVEARVRNFGGTHFKEEYDEMVGRCADRLEALMKPDMKAAKKEFFEKFCPYSDMVEDRCEIWNWIEERFKQ